MKVVFNLMMLIVSLKYTRRRTGGYVEVVLDNGESFELDADLTVQFHLARGMELDEARLETIKEAQNNLMARRRLLQYISVRRKTVAEARRFLLQLDFPPGSVDSAIEAAQALGYLDDSSYAKSFVSTHTKASSKGPRALKYELAQRGVERSLAEEAVEPVSGTDQQMTAARALAAKRFQSLKNEPVLSKASKKLSNYLLRKGYDNDVSAAITREFFGDPTEG